MIAILNWTPNETIYFAILMIVLYRFGDTFGAFIDNQVQHYYEKWFKR